MQLDQQDKFLLKALQEDCRISNQQLAEQAGMSASACWRRIRILEDAGIIKNYRAIVDGAKAGKQFNAIVHISLARHNIDHVNNFIEKISLRPEVLECVATTGDADYHLKIICNNQNAYNDFLEGFLFRLPGVANIRTNLILKNIKTHASIPL